MEPAALLITAIVGAVSALIAALIAARKLTFEREHSEAETAATWTDAQAVVIGNNRKYLSALITLDEEKIPATAKLADSRAKDAASAASCPL